MLGFNFNDGNDGEMNNLFDFHDNAFFLNFKCIYETESQLKLNITFETKYNMKRVIL